MASQLGREADKIALYLRVANSLRSRIGDGEWPAGSQLPIIKDLAKEYNVALVTVRQAIGILSEDGMVEGAQGRGTFVRDGVRSVRDNQNLRAAINDRLALAPGITIQVLGRVNTSAPLDEFVPNDIPRRAKYVTVRKLHLQDGEPFALMDVSVAQDIYRRFPKGADRTTKLLRLIIDHGNVVLSRSRIEITIAHADLGYVRPTAMPADGGPGENPQLSRRQLGRARVWPRLLLSGRPVHL